MIDCIVVLVKRTSFFGVLENRLHYRRDVTDSEKMRVRFAWPVLLKRWLLLMAESSL